MVDPNLNSPLNTSSQNLQSGFDTQSTNVESSKTGSTSSVDAKQGPMKTEGGTHHVSNNGESLSVGQRISRYFASKGWTRLSEFAAKHSRKSEEAKNTPPTEKAESKGKVKQQTVKFKLPGPIAKLFSRDASKIDSRTDMAKSVSKKDSKPSTTSTTKTPTSISPQKSPMDLEPVLPRIKNALTDESNPKIKQLNNLEVQRLIIDAATSEDPKDLDILVQAFNLDKTRGTTDSGLDVSPIERGVLADNTSKAIRELRSIDEKNGTKNVERLATALIKDELKNAVDQTLFRDSNQATRSFTEVTTHEIRNTEIGLKSNIEYARKFFENTETKTTLLLFKDASLRKTLYEEGGLTEDIFKTESKNLTDDQKKLGITPEEAVKKATVAKEIGLKFVSHITDNLEKNIHEDSQTMKLSQLIYDRALQKFKGDKSEALRFTANVFLLRSINSHITTASLNPENKLTKEEGTQLVSLAAIVQNMGKEGAVLSESEQLALENLGRVLIGEKRKQ